MTQSTTSSLSLRYLTKGAGGAYPFSTDMVSRLLPERRVREIWVFESDGDVYLSQRTPGDPDNAYGPCRHVSGMHGQNVGTSGAAIVIDDSTWKIVYRLCGLSAARIEIDILKRTVAFDVTPSVYREGVELTCKQSWRPRQGELKDRIFMEDTIGQTWLWKPHSSIKVPVTLPLRASRVVKPGQVLQGRVVGVSDGYGDSLEYLDSHLEFHGGESEERQWIKVGVKAPRRMWRKAQVVS